MAQQPARTHTAAHDDVKERPTGDTEESKSLASEERTQAMPQLGPQPLAGVFTASVRITNLYVQGGPALDVLVTKSNGNLTIAPGMSGIVALSDTITAIATVAGQNSGGATRTPVDIG